jgi:hypothetical protein
MYKIIKLCALLILIWTTNSYADDGFFYVSILLPPGAVPQSINGNSVIIDYKICDYVDNKPTKCVLSQGSIGGKVGQAYGIVQSLLPNQRVSAFEASLFVPNQMYPLFTQSFPILADGTTSCVNEPDKNYLTFYADAMGMKIVCAP